MNRPLLRVLAYHRVLEPAPGAPHDSVVSATPGDFARQMRHLAESYDVVSASEVLDAVRGRWRLPDRAVLVTFDDAYRDFAETAWPIMRRYGLPATVFVPTGFPDRPEREFWWDRLHRAFASTSRRSLEWAPLGSLPLGTPEDRRASLRRVQSHLKGAAHDAAMRGVERLCVELGGAPPAGGSVLGWDELRELARDGVALGAHTRSHPALSRLPPGEMRDEVLGSRDDLRREIGEVLPIFAYPFGAYDDRVVEAVREAGFELAVTCLDGRNRLGSTDPLRLHRTNVTRRTSPFVFRLRLLGPVSYLDAWRHRGERPGRDDAARRN